MADGEETPDVASPDALEYVVSYTITDADVVAFNENSTLVVTISYTVDEDGNITSATVESVSVVDADEDTDTDTSDTASDTDTEDSADSDTDTEDTDTDDTATDDTATADTATADSATADSATADTASADTASADTASGTDSDTDTDTDTYTLVGSFNEWAVTNTVYDLTSNKDGTYSITIEIDASASLYTYKVVTNHSWDNTSYGDINYDDTNYRLYVTGSGTFTFTLDVSAGTVTVTEGTGTLGDASSVTTEYYLVGTNTGWGT